MGLARLIAAGLPVPAGFAIEDAAFRALVGELAPEHAELGHALTTAADRIAAFGAGLRTRAAAAEPADDPAAAFARDVTARAAALGTLAVRSSATIEDGDAGSAAGVFSSRRAVPPAEVWDAICAVWTSALTPLAATYARRRGGTIAIGVVIQAFVPGIRHTVYTRPPGRPAADEVLIQEGGDVRMASRSAADPIVVLALRAEAAIGAREGADVELAGDGRVVVQARPIVHPVARPRVPPPPSVLAPLVADGRRWTWDVAHNPDPLSPAQAALVELVDRAEVAPWSLRVCAGFLYTAPRGEPPQIAAASTAAELAQRAAALETRLAEVLGEPGAAPRELPDALARYVAFYRIWASELGPLISATRATLAREVVHGGRTSAVEATLLAAARGEISEAEVLAQLGPLSPAWDIAVPSFAERPELVRDAIVRAREVAGRVGPAPQLAAPGSAEEQLARATADLAERDDAWFARAQHLVRRAVLARARAVGLAPEDACWLPLDELVAGSGLGPEEVRRRASATRAASARASRWEMPLVVGGPAADRAVGVALHGIGAGSAGRATGRIVRYATLGSAIAVGAGDVVVARAVTPALAVLVIGCAALVSETGGPLDHGAALARELGIPCVVGCHDAWAQLADGQVVTVDGAEGTVELHGAH